MRSRLRWLLLVLLIGGVGLHWVQLRSWAEETEEKPFGVASDEATDDDPFGVASDGAGAGDEEVQAAREEAAREAEMAKELAREAQRRAREAYQEVERLRLQLNEAEALADRAAADREANAKANARGGDRYDAPRGGLGPDGRRPGPPKENADVREDFVFHFPPDRRPVQVFAKTIVGGEPGPHGVPHEIRDAARMTVDAPNDEEKRQADDKLGALLERYFEEDLERRQEELAKIEERLAKLRELVAKRREKKEEIIDLQRKVALNEAAGLGFYHEPGPGVGHFPHLRPGHPDPVRVPLPPIPPTPVGGELQAR